MLPPYPPTIVFKTEDLHELWQLLESDSRLPTLRLHATISWNSDTNSVNCLVVARNVEQPRRDVVRLRLWYPDKLCQQYQMPRDTACFIDLPRDRSSEQLHPLAHLNAASLLRPAPTRPLLDLVPKIEVWLHELGIIDLASMVVAGRQDPISVALSKLVVTDPRRNNIEEWIDETHVTVRHVRLIDLQYDLPVPPHQQTMTIHGLYGTIYLEGWFPKLVGTKFGLTDHQWFGELLLPGNIVRLHWLH